MKRRILQEEVPGSPPAIQTQPASSHPPASCILGFSSAACSKIPGKNPSELQKFGDKQPGRLYSREKSIASVANASSDRETAVILHAAAEENLSGGSGAVRRPCSLLPRLCSFARAGSESPALSHRATAGLTHSQGHLGVPRQPWVSHHPLPSAPAPPAPPPPPRTEVSCPRWDGVCRRERQRWDGGSQPIHGNLQSLST